MSIDPLNITTTALVLENSPAVLSLGKLCALEGFTFHWESGRRPTLTDEIGIETDLEVRNFVPVLATEEIYACPITDSEATLTPSTEGVVTEPSPTSSEQTLSAEEAEVRARIEGVPLSHLLTHLPALPQCVYCARAKATREPARRVDPEVRAQELATHDIKQFADWIWIDHIVVLREDHRGQAGEKTGAFIVDRATKTRAFYPSVKRDSKMTEIALRKFCGATNPKIVYSDNSGEIARAGEAMDAAMWTSTPNRPQSNSLTERQVRVLTEGTRALLLHSGFPHYFWPLAAAYHCVAYTAFHKHDALDGKTPYEYMHGISFPGKAVPFGMLV